MRALFYNNVEFVSEKITGLDSSNLSIFDLGRYIAVSDDVALWMNIGSAILVAFIASNIIYWAYRMIKHVIAD